MAPGTCTVARVESGRTGLTLGTVSLIHHPTMPIYAFAFMIFTLANVYLLAIKPMYVV